MDEIKAVLKEKIKRTDAIASFRFEPEKKAGFLPGQFMEVILDEENKSLRHFLSFSSSPARDYIEFTKKISDSAFCRKLMELKEADEILLRLPFGSCVYKKEYEKIGFLIGGVGITPVVSMLEYIADKDLDTDCFLIYSNRNEAEIAFKKELDTWRKSINLKIVYLVTEQEPHSGDLQKGFINYDYLLNCRQTFQERLNFIFGSPGMVGSLAEILRQLGIEESRIKMEKFAGY